jgi:collagen type VII alpha
MLRFVFAILAALALVSEAQAQVPINPSNLPLVTQTARGAVPQTGTPTGKVLTDSATWSALTWSMITGTTLPTGLTIPTPTITGGTINGTTIGATTPAAGTFTNETITGTLGVTGATTLSGGGTLGGTFTGAHTLSGVVTMSSAGTALVVTNSASIGNTLTINPSSTIPLVISNNLIQVTGTGNGPLTFRTLGSGNFSFFTEGGTTDEFQINDVANSISWLRVSGGISGNGPTIQAVGDTAANINLFPGATGFFNVGGARTILSGMLQIQGNRTYVATNPIQNTGPNYAALWEDTAVTGTTGAGASTYNFIRVTDSLNANASGFYPLNINHLINAGWDGFRQALAVSQQVTAASGGNGNLNTIGFFARFGNVGNQLNEGGTGNPNDSSSWHASTVNVNIDTGCNVLYSQGCEGVENDMRNMAPTFSKKIEILSYSINDSAHGLDDCALCIVGNSAIAPGTGRGLYIIELGGETSGWPLDESNANTVIMGEFKQNVGNQGAGYPFQSNAGHGWYFPGANFVNDAWYTTGHRIDGAGQAFIGPGSITYDQTGLYIGATNLTTTTATIGFGGVGYIVGDHVLEPISGGQWQVTTVGTNGLLTGLAPLSPARPGFPATCPSGLQTLLGGGGHAATATISCSAAANQITLQPSGGITSVGGRLNTLAGISDTSAGGGTTFPGGGLGILTTGDLSSNQTIANWALATQSHKTQGITTTLNITGTATQVWENFNPQVFLNGTINAEINVLHSTEQMAAGSSSTYGEAAELELINNGGTINNGWSSALSLILNNSGTAVNLIGFQALITNNGTVGEYDAFNCAGLTGTQPTGGANYCLRNRDALAMISTLGQVVIGAATPLDASAGLTIQATGSTQATHSIVIKNSATANVLILNDDGTSGFRGTIQTGTSASSGSAGGLQINGSTAGSIKLISNTQNITGNYNINIPSGQTDTVMMLGLNQTMTGNLVMSGSFTTNSGSATTFNGNVNFVSSVQYQGFVGVSATAPTIQSGFGTGATVTNARGTKRFQVNVGTGGTASSGVVGMPLTNQGWVCTAVDTNTSADNNVVSPTGTSNVTITNYGRTTGTPTAWAASTIVWLNCDGG